MCLYGGGSGTRTQSSGFRDQCTSQYTNPQYSRDYWEENSSLNLYINIISYFLIIVKESLYFSTTFPWASLFICYILFENFTSSASIFLFAEPTAIYIIPKIFWRLRPLFTTTHYEKRLRLCLGA